MDSTPAVKKDSAYKISDRDPNLLTRREDMMLVGAPVSITSLMCVSKTVHKRKMGLRSSMGRVA
ncbi:hypothetical protein DSO57_1015168 [Entomophthora muscae]|uniref:Uncharacterized protein n=1 Tax=Entomophthora muscae TaxID=34485 RepID=A0ACC2RJS4_9FUNG|nr:hypothetical protein DSO57_1015168 [Entomophthora muscae]